MRIRLSNKSYDDAVAMATLNGRKGYHEAMFHLVNDFSHQKTHYLLAEEQVDYGTGKEAWKLLGYAALIVDNPVLGKLVRLQVREELKPTELPCKLINDTCDYAKGKLGLGRIYIATVEDDDHVHNWANACEFRTADTVECEEHGKRRLYARDLDDERTVFERMLAISRTAHDNPIAKLLGGLGD